MRKLLSKMKLNKKSVAALSVFVFAVGLLICGLSIAFFSDRDVVTNKHEAKEITIKLLEPEWKAAGETKAAKLEPGMVIEKDPYVYNDSEYAVYVRMKIVLKAKNDNAEYVELDKSKASDAAIYEAIMSAIYCGAGDENDVRLIGDNGASQSKNFVLEADGWFYYKNDKGYIAVESGEGTTKLFDNLKIPVLKSEYNHLFDSEFQIEIIAQAVSAKYEGEAAIKAAFEKDFQQVESE